MVILFLKDIATFFKSTITINLFIYLITVKVLIILVMISIVLVIGLALILIIIAVIYKEGSIYSVTRVFLLLYNN